MIEKKIKDRSIVELCGLSTITDCPNKKSEDKIIEKVI